MDVQIQELKTSRMPNALHFDYFCSLRGYLGGQSQVTALPEYTAFDTCLNAEDDAMILTRKDAYTASKAENDRVRDSAYIGYKQAVKTFTAFPAGAQKEAADRLWQQLQDYKINPRMEINAETGLLTNLIQDLRGKYAQDVAMLNLGIFLDTMDDANQKVMAAREGSVAARDAKVLGQLRNARAATDEAYRLLVRKINALQVVNGEKSGMEAVIDNMNARIDEYRQKSMTKRAPKSVETVPETSQQEQE